MNLRTTLLVFGLLTAFEAGLVCSAQTVGAHSSDRRTRSASAARLRSARPSDTSRGDGSNPAATGAAQPNGGDAQQPPARAENASIEVTGRTRPGQAGTLNTPLLPLATPGNGLGIRSGTPIAVRLRAAIDSGHVRNGDMIDATLAAPLAGLPAGTPVQLTVVQAAPAGRLFSYGELSIQVVSIAEHRVLSDVITAQGKEGAKEIQDAAPARGTEATFTPDQIVTLPAA